MYGYDEGLDGEEPEREMVLLVEGEQEVEHGVEDEQRVLFPHVGEELVGGHQHALFEASLESELEQGEDVGLAAGFLVERGLLWFLEAVDEEGGGHGGDHQDDDVEG